MGVAVQQPLAECTAIFTVCIVTAHLPLQRQITKPACINGGTDSRTVPASKICAGNTPVFRVIEWPPMVFQEKELHSMDIGPSIIV